jgi:hypothetical protein
MPKIGNRKENYKPADDYYTPRWIFEALNTTFDVDVCAPCEGVPWLPAKHYWCIENDGLQQQWYGRVWMNPPYSGAAPWIDKFIEHGNGIALIQTSKSNGFIRMWNEMDAVMYLPRNMQFQHITEGMKPVFMPTALFAMGQENVDILKASGINKVR